MQTRNILAALAVVVMMMLAACAPTDLLNGTSWTLTTLIGEPALPYPLVTLNFEDGKLSGSDGCNRYATSYTAQGGQIEVNANIATTMMACDEPIMRQATVYLALLPLASGYKINSGQLTLTEASGKELAVFSAQSKELGGTSWIVTGYNNGKQAVVSVLNGTELTADFSADGKLSGSAGCNRYNTTYKTSGKSIQIGPPASTRMMCAEPAGVMGQEAQYLKALESAATYRLDGDTLEFRTAEDAMAVTFKKVR